MIKFKGILKNIDDLAIKPLPQNAVRLEEGSTIGRYIRYVIYVVIIGFAIKGMVSLKADFFDTALNISHSELQGLWITLLLLPVHEIFHGILLPKGVVGEIWIYFKYLLPLNYVYEPVKKGRYMLVALAPFLLLCVIPCVVWFFVDTKNVLVNIIWLSTCYYSGIICVADLDLFGYILLKIPKGAFIQNVKDDTFWFI